MKRDEKENSIEVYKLEVEALMKQHKKEPNNKEIKYDLVFKLINMGEYENAKDICDKQYSIGDLDIVLLYCLFMIESELLNYKKAYEYFSLITKMDEQVKLNFNYKTMLLDAYAKSQYEEVFTDQQYSQIQNDIYNIWKPMHVNKFKIETSLFRVINIGFISYDFFAHPVGYFIMSLFREKSKYGRIKYFCYYTRKDTIDGVTEIIQKSVDVFKDVSNLNNMELENEALKDNLDILFDLNSFSSGGKHEVLINRLAPIQIAWIGWPSSTCIQNMDYTLVDKYTDPIGWAEKYYTEKLMYMPKTFLCNALDVDVEIKKIPVLRNGIITFGVFCNGKKITDKMLLAWSTILKRVKGSQLVILSSSLNNNDIKKQLIKKIINSGIDINNTKFVSYTNIHEYFDMYNEVDIMLDTYPFNGATTTTEAFIMGVPIISLCGEKHASRVGYSMLKNVKQDDLAQFSLEGYIDKAVALAYDLGRLQFLRRNLRSITLNSPLANTAVFKENMEFVLRYAFMNYCLENKNKLPNYKKEVSVLIKESLIGLDFLKNYIFELNNEDARLILLIEEIKEMFRVLCQKLKYLYKNKPFNTELITNMHSLANNISHDIKIFQIEDIENCIKKLFKIS